MFRQHDGMPDKHQCFSQCRCLTPFKGFQTTYIVAACDALEECYVSDGDIETCNQQYLEMTCSWRYACASNNTRQMWQRQRLFKLQPAVRHQNGHVVEKAYTALGEKKNRVISGSGFQLCCSESWSRRYFRSNLLTNQSSEMLVFMNLC